MGALFVRASRSRDRRVFGSASRWIASFLIGAALLTACAEESASRSVAESVVAQTGSVQATTGSTAEAQQVERKQIQDARLRLEVESCEAARRAIETDVAGRSGFVSDIDLQHVDGRVSRATIVLRMPSAELAGAIQHYALLGTLLREELDTRDVTDEYHDVEARLSSARQLEGRLLELLATNTAGLPDVLKVEHELARVRETIERYEGKLRLWASQVALSTLTIELVERSSHVAASPPLAARLGETFDSSWGALLSVGEAFVHLVVALAPWIPPFALLAWLSLRCSRHLNQRRTRSFTAS